MHRIIVAALLLSALLTGCIDPSTRVRPERGSQPAERHDRGTQRGNAERYQVQAGDTLFRIAFNHQVSVDELVEWNDIADRNKIFVGQSLQVSSERMAAAVSEPVRTSASYENVPTPVDVRPGPSQTDPQTGVVTSGVVTTAATEAGTEAVPLTVSPTEPVPSPSATPAVTAEPDEATMPAPSMAESIPEPASGLGNGAAPTALRGGWSWPLAGKVVGTFAAGDTTRSGLDIAGSEGQAVYAAADGEVVYSGTGILGYGELIVIQHPNGLLSAYGHNRRRLVSENAPIKRGQQIAEMGRDPSGRQLLHFEIRKNGKPVDPLGYLPGK